MPARELPTPKQLSYIWQLAGSLGYRIKAKERPTTKGEASEMIEGLLEQGGRCARVKNNAPERFE